MPRKRVVFNAAIPRQFVAFLPSPQRWLSPRNDWSVAKNSPTLLSESAHLGRGTLEEHMEVLVENPVSHFPDTSEPFVNAERAAMFLSLTRKTLLRLVRRGSIPAHGIGEGRKKIWRFRISELDHWMQTEVTLGSDGGRIQERKNFL